MTDRPQAAGPTDGAAGAGAEAKRPAPDRADRQRHGGDGLGGLVGGGGSQVGTNGAMRARDVSRPR